MTKSIDLICTSKNLFFKLQIDPVNCTLRKTVWLSLQVIVGPVPEINLWI